MLTDHLCVIRGGGDLATGVAWRLTRCGFGVIVTELSDPLTVRRAVAMSTAVAEGSVDVEGLVGRLVEDVDGAIAVAKSGEVAVMVCAGLPEVDAAVVIDARLAKRNIDTCIEDAPLVIGLGPGFTAGLDCDAVVETKRGHGLGRVLWQGAALPNTGSPGLVAGYGVERVLRAPIDGEIRWEARIGDDVSATQHLGDVSGEPIKAPFDGVVRGLIRDGRVVTGGLKIGDIDPRAGAPYNEVSDKALAVGGGVVEAVMTWLKRQR